MKNLLTETQRMLEKNGHPPTDVLWVGGRVNRYTERSEDFTGTWQEFAAIANIDYNAGYGREEINLSLLVVGDSWWLERHEFDGQEWWEYKKLPTKPENARSIKKSDVLERTSDELNESVNESVNESDENS